jgi:hypothetical protein
MRAVRRGRAMERNKWETAIRCLEVALHPNTSDDEAIAGVNGFRRTADGTPLSEICVEFAGASEPVDKISRENLDLRRRLERERQSQIAALKRLHEAERLIRELSEEIRAEQQSFADFRSASAQIVGGLKDENIDLRGALDEASHAPARQSSPFRDILAAALGEVPDTVGSGSNVGPPQRHPWTA